MERVEALTAEVHALRAEIHPLDGRLASFEAALLRRTRWLMAAVASTALVLAALVVTAFVVEAKTRDDIATANRKLCPMVALLIPDSARGRPVSTYTKQVAEQARLLYQAYGCPPAKGN